MVTLVLTLVERPSVSECNEAAKVAKSAILSKLFSQIEIVKEANNGKISYGYVKKQVLATKHFCPWLTWDIIVNEYRRCEKKKKPLPLISADASQVVVVEPVASIVAYDPKRKDRPKGTTTKRKCLFDVSVLASRNEIATLFQEEKEIFKTSGKRMKKGCLIKLINEIKQKITYQTDLLQ